MSIAKLIGIAAATLAISMGSTLYEVDDDRDGRADRMLILEQSDSLA